MFPAKNPRSEPRRVAVTGAGIVTSMGIGWAANAAGFRAGRTALRDVTLFDVSRQRVGRAGEVALPEALPENHLADRQRARVDRASALLIHAGAEAAAQAGLDSGAELPLVLGTSAGAMALGEDYYRCAVERPADRRGQLTRVALYQTQMQAVTLAKALGIAGPATIITNACASGANAIGHAFDLVRSGRADRALCGGYDALCQLVFAGFDSLQALSTDLPRPFDARRDGLALGEGAALFVIEPFDEAAARGADVLAEITGYGAATDGHHLTQPHPEGDAALAAMQMACAQAGIGPANIDYINSHGTGTPLNDIAEGNAIVRWGGEAVRRVMVSSTKGAIGHLLGGAGAVEAAICAMALREGWVPPTANVRDPDPVCAGFDLVTAPREVPIRRALTNSFGFGGANATLILEKAP